ncbi:MAG: hypothetical protein E6248_00455 [Clostridium sp.]|uniref:hypothetical protein n=1 Tax=Clostridium sp. TaxID=1506 RepID=UPI0029111528|nr:hypothetical protein [Clostridium sp.]MDU5108887.1 hypothetical protein [Clostridium sp.]
MGLIAYRCLECGHYTISKYDGKRCAKCDGYLVPYGNATCVDKSKSMKVQVSLKDIDLFKDIINVLKELLVNEGIPKEVKMKIEEIIKQ